MKSAVLFLSAMLFHLFAFPQTASIKANLKSEKATISHSFDEESYETASFETVKHIVHQNRKSPDEINIVPIGTSANAYSYGYGGGQRSIVNVDNELGIITQIHRMGGALDPAGFSGDLGIDISYNGGENWNCMLEIHTANIEIPGIYCNPVDVARYPSHGIFNPPGNTDPDEALAVYFAPITWCIECATWGGYIFGTAKIGDPAQITKTMYCTDTANGIHQHKPDGFTMNQNGDFWAIDCNIHSISENWLHALIVNHGTWDFQDEEFALNQELLPCITLTEDVPPPCNRVEFAPDGQTGYIVVLTDIGEVGISANRSLYPVIYKTEDAGETWGEPVAVALAGENGIGTVRDFLSDAELEEIFQGTPPPRDQIEFTTAFDFDLSVDAFGNPQIAVVVGVTGQESYSIITEISPATGKMYTAAFLLSSLDQGEPGSWIGHELGRPESFRGNFDDDYFVEDNRIQIARDQTATKMFVSWLDTDLEVSDQNNSPNIWARGVDVVNHILTANESGEDLPVNVTSTSAAQNSAMFFAMGNEVLSNNSAYTIPYVYEELTPNYPELEVQYHYIQNFQFADSDFQIVGFDDQDQISTVKISPVVPNPATDMCSVRISVSNPEIVSVTLRNLMGQTVGKPVNKKCSVGSNEINMDLSKLLDGIYFYTVKVGGQNFTNKIVVK